MPTYTSHPTGCTISERYYWLDDVDQSMYYQLRKLRKLKHYKPVVNKTR